MKMRQDGLASKGEFSVENLAFKSLRNDETIAKLNDLIIKSYDLMFSKDDLSENDDRRGLEDWEAVMLSALGTPNGKDQQHQKYGEKPPIGIGTTR
jgi:hypothetical protein